MKTKLNVERLVFESKKLDTLLCLKRGLSNAQYDALVKLEAMTPMARDTSLTDYFILTKDLRDALAEAVALKIDLESKHIEDLINGSEEPETVA